MLRALVCALQAFGNNPWRFPDDCLRCRTTWAWWLEDDIRPTPAVVPYTRVAPCQVPESSCTDLAGSTRCRELQGYGYCTDPNLQQYMAENCKVGSEGVLAVGMYGMCLTQVAGQEHGQAVGLNDPWVGALLPWL